MGSGAAEGNIRVFVRWDNQTVFAGEEIKCTITFKNVAQDTNHQKQPQRQLNLPERPRHLSPLSPLQQRGKTIAGTNSPSSLSPSHGPTRGHRSTLSLSAPAGYSRGRTGAASTQWPPQLPPHPPKSSDTRGHGHGHRRSISIVSVGSASTAADDMHSFSNTARPQRHGRGHARASSLQITPRVGLGISAPHSASFLQSSQISDRHPRSSHSATAPNTPAIGGPVRPLRSPASALSEFKFPMAPSPTAESHEDTNKSPPSHVNDNFLSPHADNPSFSRPKDTTPTPTPNPTFSRDPPTPAMRILSSTSMGSGTPRSSGEFYSMSNHSSETLASEYPAHQPFRGHHRPLHMRRSSNMSLPQPKLPENLMMGYAQVQGSFTLDGSLIHLEPFENVKRKAVVSGQGGGVVGIDTNKPGGGFLRGFGWGSITNSLGDLLGAGELSTIKDMRGIAKSKSIPLLSTPQSILFVDLQLAPGESRVFEYSFRLPKGLPPTHRGKAIKIAYTLVIGTQRAGGTREQQVRTVEIPFRVLGSVNSHGEILGHDLMSPYVLLRDQAVVRMVDKAATPDPQPKASPQPSGSSMADFLTYVDDLLNRPREGTNTGLLSPTVMPSSRRPSAFEEATTAKEAIDLAIMRSTYAAEGGQSPNRFEIARNGQRVGVVTLARPAYRLGENVIMTIDFSNADIPCYAIHCALESAERIVDPQLALRSDASVHRVTRRVHSFASDAAIYARRLTFTPTIPISFSPEFVTSGVALEWKIRIEFVVPSTEVAAPSVSEAQNQQQQGPQDSTSAVNHGDNDDDDGESAEEAAVPLVATATDATASAGDGAKPHPLLEEISRDERGGLVLVAVENIPCESFEVAVPLRVYGAAATGLEKLERDNAVSEGLVV
ncbi:hypothetical protein ACRALDRAFT_1074286 [Sodiomyces alcalophilus JCM 7366]|uniref:uncharacterized protein n=1 Tax=Sodiomyces alcalophilus JCM 7366 TaxID=591952 RepID=UPI0039B4211D